MFSESISSEFIFRNSFSAAVATMRILENGCVFFLFVEAVKISEFILLEPPIWACWDVFPFVVRCSRLLPLFDGVFFFFFGGGGLLTEGFAGVS